MAYVERHRGGRHLVETETGIDECSGWQPVCRLDEIPDGRGRPVMLKGTDVAVMRHGERARVNDGMVARRTEPEYML